MISRSTLVLYLALVFSGSTCLAGDETSTVAQSLDVSNLIGKPVTNSRWVQIARVERVLVDPARGRATFVVLSFLDRDEMLALPWNALEIDAHGRARLTAGKKTLEAAPRFYGSRVGSASPAPSPDLPYSRQPDSPGPRALAYRIVSGGKGILQGTVTGRLSVPAENGARRAQALLDVGGESVRVDLGPEDELGLAVEPGDQLRVLGRFEAGRDFQAVEVRSGTSTFRIER
jgi:hypothetical protein